jgi:hypothetical protein
VADIVAAGVGARQKTQKEKKNTRPFVCSRVPPLSPRPPTPTQLLIPAEAAHATVAALGRLGTVQFKDLNADRPAFQRTFASHVRLFFSFRSVFFFALPLPNPPCAPASPRFTRSRRPPPKTLPHTQNNR